MEKENLVAGVPLHITERSAVVCPGFITHLPYFVRIEDGDFTEHLILDALSADFVAEFSFLILRECLGIDVVSPWFTNGFTTVLHTLEFCTEVLGIHELIKIGNDDEISLAPGCLPDVVLDPHVHLIVKSRAVSEMNDLYPGDALEILNGTVIGTIVKDKHLVSHCLPVIHCERHESHFIITQGV